MKQETISKMVVTILLICFTSNLIVSSWQAFKIIRSNQIAEHPIALFFSVLFIFVSACGLILYMPNLSDSDACDPNLIDDEPYEERND